MEGDSELFIRRGIYGTFYDWVGLAYGDTYECDGGDEGTGVISSCCSGSGVDGVLNTCF